MHTTESNVHPGEPLLGENGIASSMPTAIQRVSASFSKCRSLFIICFAFFALSVVGSASTQVHPFVDCTPFELNSAVTEVGKGSINAEDGSLNKDRTPTLLEQTIATHKDFQGANKFALAANDYVIIHVVRWKDKASGADEQEIDKQNWYIYSPAKGWTQEQFTTEKHIQGVGQIYLLYIHLNRDSNASYSSSYTVTVTSKLPTYLNNLFNLLGAYTSLGGAGTARAGGKNAPNIWGYSRIPIEYKTSDIDITPQFAFMKDSACTTPSGSQAKNVTAIKIDNEGKSFIDFSVGVPISKISQLQFDTTANTISPQKVDTTNAFALVNLYYPKVDLKHSTFSWVPHFVGGVAFAKQPLHKDLFAAGWGPVFAQFYIGVLLVKEQSLQGHGCGSTAPANAGASVTSHFCPQLSYGLNIPVGGLTAALKKTTTASK